MKKHSGCLDLFPRKYVIGEVSCHSPTWTSMDVVKTSCFSVLYSYFFASCWVEFLRRKMLSNLRTSWKAERLIEKGKQFEPPKCTSQCFKEWNPHNHLWGSLTGCNTTVFLLLLLNWGTLKHRRNLVQPAASVRWFNLFSGQKIHQEFWYVGGFSYEGLVFWGAVRVPVPAGIC